MKGVRVSATGRNKLAVYIMHTHYQAQYPYAAIPGGEPPIPPEPEQKLPYPLPYMDGIYNLSIVDLGAEQLPFIDLVYYLSNKNIATLQRIHCYVDDIYNLKVIDLGEYEPVEGDPIVMSTEYEVS
ncbi:MAG: hypothetical protein HDR03_15000 [Lachnospiraceae bacterium]|nr:hypothetical protein [Lachnospiraceae bacterium]